MKKELVITIDGPSGAGKTTVSKTLAARIGYRYIDTGALYRGIALETQERGIAADDEEAMEAACRTIDLRFKIENGDLRLYSGTRDISELIRTPEISMRASAVSALAPVRAFLTVLQRRLGEERSVVFEGRDMGTVVFPEADVKFFLDADTEIRAERRYLELKAKGQDLDFEDVKKDLITRDANDSSRKLAPLRPAEDAIHVDASRIGIDEVVEMMAKVVAEIRA
ncbi:(d)CMP kinase [Desulfoluna spongiiphila]|uniref:Cytidylate kinase n=1 Tax=Desulfoluna spongiiphila TaxID=419481 RepID=A0A1G5JGD3_9BACT|nr:(d)CMP kinase [Desulfoluna spongiiphila]SCY87224.1 cytidylate kinase [Desulfoluna spongiiphila]